MANTHTSGDAVATFDPTTGVLHVEHPALAPASLVMRAIVTESGAYLASGTIDDARGVKVRAAADAMRDIITAAALTLGGSVDDVPHAHDDGSTAPVAELVDAIADEVERRFTEVLAAAMQGATMAVAETAKPLVAKLDELVTATQAIAAKP
jgi:hypothetical protein